MSFAIPMVVATAFLAQPAEVYVLRHGETTWNVENRIQGQTNESVLTNKWQSACKKPSFASWNNLQGR